MCTPIHAIPALLETALAYWVNLCRANPITRPRYEPQCTCNVLTVHGQGLPLRPMTWCHGQRLPAAAPDQLSCCHFAAAVGQRQGPLSCPACMRHIFTM